MAKSCNGCTDLETCLLVARKKNAGCKHFCTRVFAQSVIIAKTGISRQTIYNYIKGGLVVPDKDKNGNLSFSQSDFEKIEKIHNNNRKKIKLNLKQYSK